MVDATLELSATLDEVTRARTWALEQARAAGLAQDDVFALELALAESLTNVVRHAYGFEPPDRDGRDIEVRLQIDADELRVDVRDWGRQFAMPPDAGNIDLDEPRTGGYGLFLLKELMDEVVSDTSHSQGTTLRMGRRRGVQR